MKVLQTIVTLLPFMGFSQLYVGENALLHVGDGANLEVGGNLENQGAIQNLGTISLFADWTENNNYNGSEGGLHFLGSADQMILADELVMKELTVNTLGAVSFPGSEYLVTDRIEFQFGTVETGADTRFILGEDITIIPGSNNSYFEGSLISRGTGQMIFPVGSQGIYAPLTLLDVRGNDLEIEVSYNRDNPVNPTPGDSLLGVSHRAFWELDLLQGSTDDVQIQLEFNEEDLNDFIIENTFRFRSSSPAIAFTRNLVNRWQSLGVESISNSDSVTFGTITSSIPYALAVGEKAYLAMAIAPIAPANGLLYVPEVFSPNADDADNRFFKVFGQRITNENFSLQVYNRLGVRVYGTNSFTEASENGWDGTNLSGGEEPTGIYYYTLRLTFDRGQTVERSGAFYLVR